MVSTSQTTSMPHLVISLASPEGMFRRSILNFEHDIIEAVDAASSFTLLGRYSKNKDGILSGCYSHYCAWQELIRRGLSGVILEDDAQRVRHHIGYNLNSFPGDGFTILGGSIRTGGAWAREKEEFVDTCKIMDIVMGLTRGVNPIQGCRWLNSIAYFMPLEVAKKLVNIVDSNPKMQILDVWMGNQNVPQYLFFPNLYMDSDRTTSQLGTPPNKSQVDLYVCRYMREAMQERGCNFPARGGDESTLASPPNIALSAFHFLPPCRFETVT